MTVYQTNNEDSSDQSDVKIKENTVSLDTVNHLLDNRKVGLAKALIWTFEKNGAESQTYRDSF